MTPPTPHNFLVSNVTATSVSMQWSPGQITGPTRWLVFQNSELVATRWSSSYTASGLTPGASYGFSIVAIDANDDTSAPTRTIAVTTRGPGVAPGAPSHPRAIEVAPARVTIEFDRPGDEFDVHSYHIFDGATLVATVGKTPFAGATAVAAVRQLAPGSTHTFTVRASRASGLSEPSGPLTVTTPTTTDTLPPIVPSGLAGGLAAYTCDLADLTWQESTDDGDAAADLDYEVFVGAAMVTSVRGAGAAFSVSLPGPGAHAIAVRAVDSSGNASGLSPAITVTVDPTCEP